MENTEQSHPLWYAARSVDSAPSPLDRDMSADVCVIGAGIAGIATAYQLACGGRNVVVLDDGPIAGGETGRTTAHLSSAIDDRYYRIETLHGREGAQICYQSHTAAIDWYEQTAVGEKIDCDFTRLDGFLFLPPGEDEQVLQRELDAAHHAGFHDVERIQISPLTSFDTGPCLRFPNQGQIDPLAFIEGLAKAFTARGGQMFCESHVTEIDDKNGLMVKTESGACVRAGAVVVATNSPINTLFTMHTKQHAYRSYVIGIPVKRGSVPLGLYWDTSQDAGDAEGPYHYVRLQRSDSLGNGNSSEEDMLIVGGEDHKTGQADDALVRWRRLEKWAQERFSVTGPAKYRWSGQIMEPVDDMAFIGPSPTGPAHTYIITGDSGMGMTHGVIGAILITDLIEGRNNPWAKLYDPARKSIRSAMNYAQENINVAAQYMDWLLGGDVDSINKIRPGSGAIVRSGFKLIACYRDPEGALHECSAACTHLNGVVQWNAAEHTWDCPCHGSRFDPYGKVLNGPAITPLAETHTLSTVESEKL